MKNTKPSVSVITIARNEEKTIKMVIESSLTALLKVTNNFEILVNDDASNDSTSKILDKLAKKNRSIKVYHQKKSIGIVNGVEFLYTKARYELLFINPGDGQYSAEDLPRMMKKIEQGYDFVIGHRIHKKYTIQRKMVSFCFNFIPELLFGIKLYDAGSTKLFKRKILSKTKPVSSGVFREAERIIMASRLGYKVTSIPAHHFKRKGGKASGVSYHLIVEALIDMVRFWIYLQFVFYKK
jgi:glycosyltransferase involved in cell wall biosynthesis